MEEFFLSVKSDYLTHLVNMKTKLSVKTVNSKYLFGFQELLQL